MRWVARAVSVPTADTETCLSIFFESQPSHKYLFNCGEGTFRAIQQRKVGLNKIKAVFLTGINTSRSSGLSSLLMSVSDAGAKSLEVVGPPGLNHFVATTRSYALRQSLQLRTTECPPPNPAHEATSSPRVFKDHNLSLYAVSILPEGSPEPVPSTHSLKRKSPSSPTGRRSPSPELSLSHSERIIQQSFCGTGEDGRSRRPIDWELHAAHLPPAPRSVVAVGYIGIGPVVRGKFNADRAKEFGIFGSARAELTRGTSVLAKDGVTFVTPDMCIGPSTPASAFIFVDCPDPTYIPGIVASPQFRVKDRFKDAVLRLIVHRIGRGVLGDSRYQTWMQDIGENVEHLIASEEYGHNSVSNIASAYLQLQLSELDPKIYTVPTHRYTPTAHLHELNLITKPMALDVDHIIAMHPPAPAATLPAPGMTDNFHPALEAKMKDPKASILSPTLTEVFSAVRDDVKAHEQAASRAPQPGDDVVVTTLGTGSALPSKTRNVLSNLVQVPRWGNVLLDAGEGTWGQIARRFGSDHNSDGGGESPAHTILRELRCIFISHIHADHHVGLAKILSMRRQLPDPPSVPLFLIGNKQMFDYLREYTDLEDIGIDDLDYVRCIYSADISVNYGSMMWREKVRLSPGEIARRRVRSNEARAELQKTMGFKEIRTVEVLHRGPCYGIVLKHSEDWSIVFSGDTMPSDELVKAGQGATLLIHEATMADDQTELAAMKQHSTIGQALDIGKRMKAKNILLTHFSQRYPKIPLLNPPSRSPPAQGAIVTTDDDFRFGPEAAVPTPDTSQSNAPAIPPDNSNSDSDPIPIVGLAFDCASIPIGSMWKVNRYTPALEKLFAETAVTGDEDEDLALIAAAMNIPSTALTGESSFSTADPAHGAKNPRAPQADASGSHHIEKKKKKQKKNVA